MMGDGGSDEEGTVSVTIRKIDEQKVPLGIRLLEKVGLCGCYQGKRYELLCQGHSQDIHYT